jgi:hypothetical protein
MSPRYSFIFLLILIILLIACQGVETSNPPTQTPTAEIAVAATATQPPTATPQPDPTASPTQPPPATLPIKIVPIPSDEPSLEAQEYYYKGLTYYAAGLTGEAIASFEQAIVLSPDYVLAYQHRGDAYRQMEQYEQARADYLRVLELTTDPTIRAEVEVALQETNKGLAGQLQQPNTPTPNPSPTPEITLAEPRGPLVAIPFDQPTALMLGQVGELEERNIKIQFHDVLEDSRCPTQVECVWSGQARVLIGVQIVDIEALLELNTVPAFKENVASISGYKIRLAGLDPHPEDPDRKIPKEDYVVTLVVSKE